MVSARGRLEGRRRRPRPVLRLVLSALVLSALVLGVRSIVTASSRSADVAMAYADRVRPTIDRSTRQVAALDDLRNRAGQLGPTGLRKGLDRLVRDSNDIATTVDRVHPPSSLDGAHGLLRTCLLTRAEALTALSRALSGDVAHQAIDQPIAALMTVGTDLAVSDRAYQLFLERLPVGPRRTMPASTWDADPTRWDRPEVSAFVATLRNSTSLAPVHDVGIVTVSTDPLPVGADPANGAKILPLAKTLRLQVVVANAGNAAEKRVAVEAVIISAGGEDTGRQFIDLLPGQRETVALSVRPAPVGVMTLKVHIVPVAGESSIADNEQDLQLEMR